MGSDDALVLLHIGPKVTTVSFLSNGTLALTRAIDIGSEQLNNGLTEAHNVSVSDEKAALSAIQDRVQDVLEPLANEIRAAIDYFDHLEGKAVSEGYIAGELAQSSLVIETLKGLEIPCQRLDQTAFLSIVVSEESLAEAGNPLSVDLETDLPQLDVALGAALGWNHANAIDINLLVDELEAAELRRRDPVRWTIRVGAAAALVLLLWAGWLAVEMVVAGSHLSKAQAEWRSLEKPHKEALAVFKKVGEMERCWSAAVSLISARNRSLPSDAPTCGRSTFSATSRSCLTSRARYTMAIPPRPISRWIVYWPPRAAVMAAVSGMQTG